MAPRGRMLSFSHQLCHLQSSIAVEFFLTGGGGSMGY